MVMKGKRSETRETKQVSDTVVRLTSMLRTVYRPKQPAIPGKARAHCQHTFRLHHRRRCGAFIIEFFTAKAEGSIRLRLVFFPNQCGTSGQAPAGQKPGVAKVLNVLATLGMVIGAVSS